MDDLSPLGVFLVRRDANGSRLLFKYPFQPAKDPRSDGEQVVMQQTDKLIAEKKNNNNNLDYITPKNSFVPRFSVPAGPKNPYAIEDSCDNIFHSRSTWTGDVLDGNYVKYVYFSMYLFIFNNDNRLFLYHPFSYILSLLTFLLISI